jgi:hypothetical protein
MCCLLAQALLQRPCRSQLSLFRGRRVLCQRAPPLIAGWRHSGATLPAVPLLLQRLGRGYTQLDVRSSQPDPHQFAGSRGARTGHRSGFLRGDRSVRRQHPLALPARGTGRARRDWSGLEELKKKDATKDRSGQIATIYAGLGDREQMFEWLEKAYQRHSNWLVHELRSSFIYNPFRSDPRFTDLIRRVGFPP